MSRGATKKTNNDLKLLIHKVDLRLMSLPDKQEINVLEAFGGEGILWNEVRKLTDQKINTLSIDINTYEKINLKGDNLKFLKSIDLKMFDIIDLDSWGSPVEQLLILKQRNYKGVVHCTFIQTMFGALNLKMLSKIGYPERMVKKCRSLFNKNGMEKMKQFLAIEFEVSEIMIFSHKKKNYFYFILS
jgi:tRNA G26 N,N-dimethylase Trm1